MEEHMAPPREDGIGVVVGGRIQDLRIQNSLVDVVR